MGLRGHQGVEGYDGGDGKGEYGGDGALMGWEWHEGHWGRSEGELDCLRAGGGVHEYGDGDYDELEFDIMYWVQSTSSATQHL
jgi:hypothetical protein